MIIKGFQNFAFAKNSITPIPKKLASAGPTVGPHWSKVEPLVACDAAQKIDYGKFPRRSKQKSNSVEINPCRYRRASTFLIVISSTAVKAPVTDLLQSFS